MAGHDTVVVVSNCAVWAAARYTVLLRQWWAAGRPVGLEPALRIRASRLEPRKAPHVAVEHWTGQAWMREEWVPLDQRPLAWWTLWRALWTRGRVAKAVVWVPAGPALAAPSSAQDMDA